MNGSTLLRTGARRSASAPHRSRLRSCHRGADAAAVGLHCDHGRDGHAAGARDHCDRLLQREPQEPREARARRAARDERPARAARAHGEEPRQLTLPEERRHDMRRGITLLCWALGIAVCSTTCPAATGAPALGITVPVPEPRQLLEGLAHRARNRARRSRRPAQPSRVSDSDTALVARVIAAMTAARSSSSCAATNRRCATSCGGSRATTSSAPTTWHKRRSSRCTGPSIVSRRRALHDLALSYRLSHVPERPTQPTNDRRVQRGRACRSRTPPRHRHRARRRSCARAVAVRQRAVFDLHYKKGMTHSEIAEALELPIGTIKSDLVRGHEKLKEWLTGGTQ